jgi:hypothetical protein
MVHANGGGRMAARLSITVEVDLPTGTQEILDASFPAAKGVQYSRIISGYELCKLVPSTVPWMVRSGYRENTFLISVTGDKDCPERDIREVPLEKLLDNVPE